MKTAKSNKPAIHHCIICGIAMHLLHKRKYCSDRCNPHKRIWDKSPRACITCQSIYRPVRQDHRYCNRSCQPYGNGGREKYYQTKDWKFKRATFILAHTIVNGLPISNKYCIECYKREGRLNDMYAVDHIMPRKQHGTDDHRNLQSLCKHHHQSKSAQEGNSNADRNRGGRPRRKGRVGEILNID